MINETILSRMVKDFGDPVMQIITGDLYTSGPMQLLLFCMGTYALISLGISLHKGEAPTKAIMFCFAWLCCLPVNGKPLFYVTLNGIGSGLSYTLQESTTKVLEGLNANSKAMPPGWVMNALTRAAAAEISDSNIQDRLVFIVDNCIPNVNNNSGDALTIADLFGGKINASGGSETHIERFDPKYLRSRKFHVGGHTQDCYEILKQTRAMLRSHLRGKDLTHSEPRIYVGSNAGETIDPARIKDQWAEPTTSAAGVVRNVALNVATASAVQKALTNQAESPGGNWLTRKYHTTINSATHALVSPATTAAAGNYLTSVTFDVMSTPMAIMRALEVDGAMKAGSLLQEMNEKLLSLPYYTAYVQVILKILVPIVGITIFFGTLRFASVWAFSWIVTLLLPAVINISRGIANSIMFHTNKMGEYARVLESEPGFLAHGIDFSAANQILADSSRMMMDILSIEMGIWGSLLGVGAIGGYLAGGIANKTASVVGTSLTSGLLFSAGGIAARAGIKTIGAGVGYASGGVGNAAARGMNALGTLRGMGRSLGQMGFTNHSANSVATNTASSSPRPSRRIESQQTANLLDPPSSPQPPKGS